MNESAQEAIDWARKTLDENAKSFLAGLPLCIREEKFCFVHASASFPERWDYIDGLSAARKSIEAAERVYTFSGQHLRGGRFHSVELALIVGAGA